MFYVKVSHVVTKLAEGSCDGETLKEVSDVFKKNQLLECLEVTYHKVRFHDPEEFDSNLTMTRKKWGSGSVSVAGNNPDPPTSQGLEYVELVLGHGDDTRVVLAVDCSVFIMNDHGRTIDTVFCK